jgi:uncharacterized cupredoxin-like copper-binding protein
MPVPFLRLSSPTGNPSTARPALGRGLATGAACAALVLLAACSSTTTQSPPSGAMPTAAGSTMATEPGAAAGSAMATEPGATTSAMTESKAGEETYTFGEPGQAADSTKVIEIAAADTQTFDPASVEIPLGATVTFRVTNKGAISHEFVLGDATLQAEHETEMATASAQGMPMATEANGFALEPGQTKDLVWKFTVPGEFSYACHTPGHYAAGMHGAITVK